MKKKIFALLVCLVCIVTLACGSIVVHADSSSNIDVALIEQYAEEIDRLLAEKGTNAETQLTKMSDDLNKQISQTTNEAQSIKLKKLYGVSEELLASQSGINSIDIPLYNNQIANALSGLNLVARNAIIFLLSRILGLFQDLGFDLSTELLVTSIINQEADGTYYPIYGYKVAYSQAFNDIIYGSKTSGDAEFPKAYAGLDGDLYLAIHWCSFTKPSPNSKSVIITDTYDFNASEGGLADVDGFMRPVIKAVSLFHDINILTYYKLAIIESVDLETFTYNEKYGYAEKRPYIAAGETKDYKISFNTTGRRIVQTFGNLDTCLFVLDEHGQSIASAIGNGYNGNSLITWEFKKDTDYILRVQNHDNTTGGDIKLSVIWDTRYATSYDTLYLPAVDLGEYKASAELDNAYMVTFTPTETATYNIKFIPNVGDIFVAYFFEMSGTEMYSTAFQLSPYTPNSVGGGASTQGLKDPVKVIDPGGGGGDDHVITRSLTAGKQFLLIVCGGPSATGKIEVNFKIEKG